MISINVIPNHWEVKQLGDLCSTTSGGTPSRKESSYYNGNIPWVKSGELNGGLINETEEKITDEALKNSNAKIFPKGTLLIALYGATIGKMAFLGIDASTNQAVCGIFKSPEIESRFLFYFLFFSKPDLLKDSIGGAQPNISQSILKRLLIPVPQLFEQRQIVDKIEELFSELDAGRRQLETVRKQLKTYRQSVLKYAFEGKLTNKNVKNGELPDGWGRVELKDVCKSIVGGGTPSTNMIEFWSGEIPWISSADIFGIKDIRPRKKISIEAVKNSATNILPEGGIIVVTRVGLGKVAIAPYNICFSQDNQGIILNENIVTVGYTLHFLQKAVQGFKQQSRGTTINGVTKKQLGTLKFILPPLNEQKLVVTEIETRLAHCDKLEETIFECLQQSEALRQSILKRAFEGKLVTPQTI